MAKIKMQYVCQECGSIHNKWNGQCASCQAWNSLIEEQSIKEKETANPRFQGYTGTTSSIQLLGNVNVTETPRILTHIAELDRVLGGGIVNGSVVLIGGDPGIGKSTILLQTIAKLHRHNHCLYVSGEESLEQISLRAQRLDLPLNQLKMLTETNVEKILSLSAIEKPKIMVLDSIQTLYTEQLTAAPGSFSQVRESAARLVRYAKQTNTAMFLVGHVTKEGTLAGPRVLEHMVDTVLYFEGDTDSRYRILRAIKNRFGAVNELGVFAMTEQGLKGVNNPSAIFLTGHNANVSGSAIMVTKEGTRPLLVEVQALVDESQGHNPRRVTLGLDQNRLAMLLAVLNRHGGVAMNDQDVFTNIVGGIRISETAIDLPLILAALSSFKNRPLPNKLVIFGEIGLAGEIRPVPNGEERLKEAAKYGFTRAIIPAQNIPRSPIEGIDILPAKRLQDALEYID